MAGRTLLVVRLWLQAASLREMVEARYLRLMLADFQVLPLLNKFAVYKAPAVEKKNTVLVGLKNKLSSCRRGQNLSISLRRLDKVEDREKIQIVHGAQYWNAWDGLSRSGLGNHIC